MALRILFKSLILVFSQFLILTRALVLNEKYTNVFSSRTFSTFLNLFLERGQFEKRLVVCATKACLVKSNQKELRRIELDYTVTKNEIK